MNRGILITVRTNSSRLPKKCLLEIKGQKNIETLIERLKHSHLADIIVLCTTNNKEDDILCNIALDKGIEFFRGSENDKLDRWLGATKKFEIDFFVTADGDDLLCEPELIDLAFEQYIRNNSSFIECEGLICGAFTYGIKTSALQKVCDIKGTDETEMMWTYFKDSGLFKIEQLENVPSVFKRPEIRMTLDYEDDFIFFKKIIENFDGYFSLRDVVAYLDKNPEIIKINQYLQERFLENQRQKTKMVLKNTKNPSKYLGNELKYLEQVLNSESWSSTGGSWNNVFEKKFAEKFNSKYCISMNSGTSTLHAALEAAGVGYGDEVISPALTVIMDTTATIHANAIPVYADVDPETFNIDPKDIERKITPKTKAIIVVALYGLPADMDPIMDIANKHNLIVIEDNAQCFLGSYKGRMTGTIGHMASYSFENTKHISCGEGGAVITNNESLAEMVRKVGGHGFRTLRAEEGRIRLRDDEFQNPFYKRHDVIGWNYRMPEFNAAIALAQLERLDELLYMRQESAKIFIDVMKECDYLIPQKCPEGYINSYYTLGVLYEGQEKIGACWEEFRSEYKKQGGDGFYGAWSVPYLEPVMADRQFIKRCPVYWNFVSYHGGMCPVAESIQPKIMQFKTNYRNLDLAKEKAMILKKTIAKFA